jgi:hypothetical protein
LCGSNFAPGGSQQDVVKGQGFGQGLLNQDEKMRAGLDCFRVVIWAGGLLAIVKQGAVEKRSAVSSRRLSLTADR